MISKLNFNNLYYRAHLNHLDGVWGLTPYSKIKKDDSYFTDENSYMVLTALGDLKLVKTHIDKVPVDNKYLVRGAYPSITNKETDILDYIISKGFEIDLTDFYKFMSSLILNKKTINEYVKYIEFCIEYLVSKNIDLSSAERPVDEISYYSNYEYTFGWMVFLVEKKKYELVEKICDMGFKLSVIISHSFANEKVFSIIEEKEGNLDSVDGEGYALSCYNLYKQQSFILDKFPDIVDMNLLLQLFDMGNSDSYVYEPTIAIVDLYKKKGCEIDAKLLAEKRLDNFDFIMNLTLKYDLDGKYIDNLFTFEIVVNTLCYNNKKSLNKKNIKKLLDKNKISKTKIYDVLKEVNKLDGYDVKDMLELTITY